jgi:DNA-binding CsgD family transcriptional regulator
VTNEQKRELRWIMRNESHRTNRDIADDVDCAIATVRKYRHLAPKPAAMEGDGDGE